MKSKPFLVVLHGLGASSEWMGIYKKSFSNNYNVIIPDMPYSPDSGPHCGKSITGYVDYVYELLKDTIGGEESILIGESLGGAVAMVLCQKMSFKKLVLIAPSLGIEKGFMSTYLRMLLVPVDILAEPVAEKIAKSDPELGALSKKIMISTPKYKMLNPLVAMKRFSAFDLEPGCLPELLVIGGKYDKVVPEDKLSLFAGKHGANLYINNESGHHVAVNRWPDVEARIKEFIPYL